MERPVELFEVFRMGPTEKSTILNLPLTEIQSKYTLLNAVMSLEQVENAQALATFPPPGIVNYNANLFYFIYFISTYQKLGHIVVDKKEFTEMFVKQSQNSVKDNTSNLFDNVRKVTEEFEKELVLTVETFKEIIFEETKSTNEKIEYVSLRELI
jgi:hypothetical protein